MADQAMQDGGQACSHAAHWTWVSGAGAYSCDACGGWLPKAPAPHEHVYATIKPVSPTSVERRCACGKVRGMECQHQFVRAVNQDAIICGGCRLAIPYLTLLECPHHFTNELHPAVWMCARCHAPKDIVDQLCHANPAPSGMMRDLGRAGQLPGPVPASTMGYGLLKEREEKAEMERFRAIQNSLATRPYEGLIKWLPPKGYAGIDLSKVQMDPLDKQRIADPSPLAEALEKIWQREMEKIAAKKYDPSPEPEPSWPHPGPVPEHIKKQLAGPVPGPMMTDPASGPLPVPGGPTISYDEYRKYRHGQMESGPGIEKLPSGPVLDMSGWVDEYDLIPDAED